MQGLYKPRYLSYLLVPLVLVLPVILHPSAAMSMIFHGGVGISLLVGACVMGCFIWVRRSGRGVDDLLKAFPVLALIGFAAFAVYEIHSSQALTEIQQHGQRTTATILDLYEDSDGCEKHRGCNIKAKYQFTPVAGAGSSQPVTGYAVLGNSGGLNNPWLRYAQSHHTIPIAYDVTNPSNSTENFDDAAFTVNHVQQSYSTIEFKGIAFAFGIVMFWLAGRSNREKRMTP